MIMELILHFSLQASSYDLIVTNTDMLDVFREVNMLYDLKHRAQYCVSPGDVLNEWTTVYP